MASQSSQPLKSDPEAEGEAEGRPRRNSKSAKWANERLDELLGYGRYQKFQAWVFIGLVSFVGSMNYFHPMLLVTKKMHRCALPEKLEKRYGNSDWANPENAKDIVNTYAKNCTTYRYIEATCQENNLSTCFDTSKEISCTNYVHDMKSDDAFWSLSSEYDWVCDKNEVGSEVLVAVQVGIIVTALIFMQLSDTYGRVPIFHITNIIYIVMRLVAMHITSHYWAFLLLMGAGSTFSPLGIRIAYTLGAELTNDDGRLWIYGVGWVTWVAGVVVLSIIAWLANNWYYFGIIVPLCNILFIPFIWLTPESPRLLLAQGKVDKATDILRQSRRINGVKNESRKELQAELTSISEKISEDKVYGVVTLFKSQKPALYTVLLSIIWVINDFMYIGGQLNVENLAGNQFINFALVGLTELPSSFIGEFFMNRFGRRWTQVICQLGTVLTYGLITALVYNDIEGTVITVLAITAKVVSNVGWFIMWVQCVELFPTTIRVTGSNFCALVANICTTPAPYVILLGDTNPPLMYAVFLIAGLVGTVTASFIPETYKQPFPECIEDMERRPSYPYFSWRVWS